MPLRGLANLPQPFPAQADPHFWEMLRTGFFSMQAGLAASEAAVWCDLSHVNNEFIPKTRSADRGLTCKIMAFV
jgi:hypothetical protein